MKNFTPINEELNALTDIELLESYKNNIKGKIQYFPIFGIRSSIYKELVKQELSSPKFNNFSNGIMNLAWVILISFLEHNQDEDISKEVAIYVIESWDKKNLDEFLNFISNEKKLCKYFT